MGMRARQWLSWRLHSFMSEVQEQPLSDFVSSKDDLISKILKDNKHSDLLFEIPTKGKTVGSTLQKEICSGQWSLFTDISVEADYLISNRIFKGWVYQVFKISEIFNLIEWEGMLSSRCILNMKCLLIPERNYLKISIILKSGQESDQEACRWSHWIAMIGKNIRTPKSYQEMNLLPRWWNWNKVTTKNIQSRRTL